MNRGGSYTQPTQNTNGEHFTYSPFARAARAAHLRKRRSEVAAAAVRVTARSRGLVLLRTLRDERLGREHEARDAGCVLERGAHDLDRVDDALGHEVTVRAGSRV